MQGKHLLGEGHSGCKGTEEKRDRIAAPLRNEEVCAAQMLCTGGCSVSRKKLLTNFKQERELRGLVG